MRKRPPDVGHAKAGLNMQILGHVERVVVIDKAETMRLPKHREGNRSQSEADRSLKNQSSPHELLILR